jgi:hypothetical protein
MTTNGLTVPDARMTSTPHPYRPLEKKQTGNSPAHTLWSTPQLHWRRHNPLQPYPYITGKQRVLLRPIVCLGRQVRSENNLTGQCLVLGHQQPLRGSQLSVQR